MLLTIVNLSTHETEFADPSGNSTLKIKVAGSATKTDVEVTDDEFTALEPLLNAEKTAGRITWTVKRSAATLADDVPYAIKTMLTTPYNATADEDLVLVALTSPAASSVVLPVAAQIGHEVTVLDGGADAATHNITVTVASGGTINGGASFVISTNRGGAKFIKTATTEWRGLFLVGATGAPTGTAGGDLSGSYPNPAIKAGALTADATGRAMIATDYFDAATVLLKVADGAFAADTATRALFGDGIWTAAKLAANILNGAKVALVADATSGGVTTNEVAIPVVFSLLIPNAATATIVFKTTQKIEIVDVTVRKDGAGAGNTIQLTDSADANITDAIVAATDKALTRAGTIDVAKNAVVAGGTFKVVATRLAGTMACEVLVHALLRA